MNAQSYPFMYQRPQILTIAVRGVCWTTEAIEEVARSLRSMHGVESVFTDADAGYLHIAFGRQQVGPEELLQIVESVTVPLPSQRMRHRPMP